MTLLAPLCEVTAWWVQHSVGLPGGEWRMEGGREREGKRERKGIRVRGDEDKVWPHCSPALGSALPYSSGASSVRPL